MADVHDKKTRSYNMSRIRGKDTKPEFLVRKFLFSRGFRYRLNDKRFPGKPDLVLPKYKTIIFVHGCFWHGHESCKYAVIPKTRTEWWRNKIELTKLKDEKNVSVLKEMEWKVIEVWECELKKGIREKTLQNLVDKIKGDENQKS